jgi:sortase A
VSTSRRAGATILAGTGLIACGLVIVMYLTWQLVVTDWIAHRRYDTQNTALRDEWERGRSTTDEGNGRVGAIIRIPRFGADYEVPLLEGTSTAALASGIGHVEGTAAPGEAGNFVIAAHRITHGAPFRDMPDLDAGDKIVVETRDTVYTYELDTAGDALSVSDEDTWVTGELPDNPDPGGIEPRQRSGRRVLTMLTCAELFHTDERLVAFGHLTSARPARRSGTA